MHGTVRGLQVASVLLICFPDIYIALSGDPVTCASFFSRIEDGPANYELNITNSSEHPLKN